MRIPTATVLAGLALAACSEPPEPPPTHLFFGPAEETEGEPVPARRPLPGERITWQVRTPRQSPLTAAIETRFAEVLRPADLTVGTEAENQDAWVIGEAIEPWLWSPREGLNAQREDVEFWRYRTVLPMARPAAHLTHAERTLVAQPASRLENLSLYHYRSYESTVFMAMPPGATKDDRRGFVVSYPTSAKRLFGHLADLGLPAGAAPRLRRVTMDEQTRSCVLLPPPMAIRRPLYVPAGTAVQFGVGLDLQGPELTEDRLTAGKSASDGAGIRMTVHCSSREPEVVLEHFVPRDEAGSFHDLTVDLGAFADQQVEIEFATFGAADGAEGHEEARRHDFLFLAEPLLTRVPAPPVKARPNVLIVLLDTLRADALGCYDADGDGPTRTPVLDQLAREGVLFEQARTSSSWTLPSHASMFCSLLPSQHGALTLDDRLPAGFPTLAEVLRDAGWRTIAATDGVVVTPAFGLARGFDRFDIGDFGIERDSRKMLAWLDESDAPFFAFLQTYQVHDTYAPPDEYRSKHVPKYTGELPAEVNKWTLDQQRDRLGNTSPPRADIDYVRGLYHAEVAYTDTVLGEFFDELRARGLWDNTLVIVTSDHGEEFWEHGGYCHERTLYEEILRIPMIVHHPERFHGGRRVTQPVRLVDLAPTITEFLGITNPPGWVGVPLTRPSAPRDLLASMTSWEVKRKMRHRIDSRLEGTLKWIEAPDGAYQMEPPVGSQLFDLATDPGEKNPLTDPARRAEQSKALEDALARHPLVNTGGENVELSREELESLRGLGYVK